MAYASEQPAWWGQASATWHLLLLGVRRQLFSRHTLVSLLLLGCAALAVTAWTLRRDRSSAEFVEDIFLTIYVSFLLPVFCISYASAGIASEREERTLVYLLTSPLPRPLIFLAKASASLLLSMLWTVGSLWLLSWLAGPAGLAPARVVTPAIAWSTAAYVSLFCLFSVLFPRATIVALCYALFLEVFLGAMPGIVKRLAISFYTRCVIFEVAAPFGIEPGGPFQPELFLPISAAAALHTLYAVICLLLVAGVVIFTVREYAP
ncbi:MAG: ABC transporter permease [Pirellulaceae bacterium]